MGRTLHYFEWKRSWWLSLRSDREQSTTPPPTDVCQGLCAYAYHQAHVYEMLITSFANQWQGTLTPHGLSRDWLPRYPVATDPLSTQPSRGHSRPTAPELSLTPVSKPPIQEGSLSSLSMVPLPSDVSVHPPMEDGTESDSNSDYIIDEGEGFDFDD